MSMIEVRVALILIVFVLRYGSTKLLYNYKCLSTCP